MKILTLAWKLLHDCLPVNSNLGSRGIPAIVTYPLCSEDSETSSHLFLYCPLVRAVWPGFVLPIRTTEETQPD